MTRAQLLVAAAAAQPAAIETWLKSHPSGRRAILAEAGMQALATPADVELMRLMAGCICCIGQVPMRIALVRLLRQRPSLDDLLVLVAGETHLDRVRALLQEPGLGLALSAE